MKIDSLDVVLATTAVLANTFARTLTAYVLLYMGGIELNPLSRSPSSLAFGGVWALALALVLFIITDPYRKVALATYAGLLLADFVHDFCATIGAGAYITFSASVVSAVLPLLFVSIYLLYKADPRKNELKKRRNWRMFNL